MRDVTVAAPKPRPLYAKLYFQVLVGLVVGVLLGHFYPQLGVQMKPFGDAFVKLIKMVIAPLIFATVGESFLTICKDGSGISLCKCTATFGESRCHRSSSSSMDSLERRPRQNRTTFLSIVLWNKTVMRAR